MTPALRALVWHAEELAAGNRYDALTDLIGETDEARQHLDRLHQRVQRGYYRREGS